MPRDTELVFALVYPDFLGTYGDRGNALALVHRARARGIASRIVEVDPTQTVPESADVYLLGGGEDSSQLLAWDPLSKDTVLHRALADGKACLAVCAGLQLLSTSFAVTGGTHPGLGVLDVTCDRLPPGQRAVGELSAEPVGIPGLPTLTGYENHQGNAVLGREAHALGHVIRGTGNGDGKTDGVIQGNVVATYLHGPVLVRNPALADHLIETSTGPLEPYDDAFVAQLRTERLAAAE